MTLTKKQIRALRRNTTPFGLLSKEMQAAFQASYGPWEYFCDDGWCSTHSVSGSFAHHLVTPAEPALIPDVVPWDDITPGWDWVAADKDGAAFAYDTPPEKSEKFWWGTENCVYIFAFANYRRGNTSWDKSLQIRPGVV